MPQTGMDWWVVAGVVVAAITAWIAWRQLRGGKRKTENTVEHGNRNRLKGGQADTVNKVKHGDENELSG